METIKEFIDGNISSSKEQYKISELKELVTKAIKERCKIDENHENFPLVFDYAMWRLNNNFDWRNKSDDDLITIKNKKLISSIS